MGVKTSEKGDFVKWSGGEDANGLASGKGVETWYARDGSKVSQTNCTYYKGNRTGPFVARTFRNGSLFSVERGEYRQFPQSGYNHGIQVGNYEISFFQAKSPNDILYETGSYNTNGNGQLH